MPYIHTHIHTHTHTHRPGEGGMTYMLAAPGEDGGIHYTHTYTHTHIHTDLEKGA